jgi:hypothetical protein
MHEDAGEVPAEGAEPEERVVEAQPQQEDGAVIVPLLVENLRPDLHVKVEGNITPVFDERIAEDLRLVVIDELKLQGREVGEGGEGEDYD